MLRKEYFYFEKISNYQRVWDSNLGAIVGEYDSLLTVFAGTKLLKEIKG